MIALRAGMRFLHSEPKTRARAELALGLHFPPAKWRPREADGGGGGGSPGRNGCGRAPDACRTRTGRLPDAWRTRAGHAPSRFSLE
eukprot:gene22768-biopygen11769